MGPLMVSMLLPRVRSGEICSRETAPSRCGRSALSPSPPPPSPYLERQLDRNLERDAPWLLRDPDSREDLAALWKIPVAKGRGNHPRPGCPGAAPQDAVAAAEEDLRVLGIRIGREAGVPVEDRRRPLPHLPDRVANPVGGVARGIA